MKRRGSTMLEPAFITSLFLILLIGITDFGRMGFAYNSIAFAAHRAARWASTRGRSSGHAAAVADVQAEAQANLTALDNTQLTVGVTWTPNNNPGSTVQVQLTYNFKPLLIPISSTKLKLKSTSAQIIIQ
ncbi:MAG: TadE/TadG family type IV pilus assembly protein [Bryobacteraceae bacterium]